MIRRACVYKVSILKEDIEFMDSGEFVFLVRATTLDEVEELEKNFHASKF